MTVYTRTLTSADAAAAAALHAACFDDPWSTASFAAHLAARDAASLGWFEDAKLVAFALFQNVAGEADLLLAKRAAHICSQARSEPTSAHAHHNATSARSARWTAWRWACPR